MSTEHLGPYELRGELGRGAMARVWRAWDPNLEREVAIKEPLFDPRLSPDVLEEMGRRFVKEGKTAARLQHPGIVTIFAADVYDGRPAIVMELIEGTTLADLLEKGPLDPESSLDVLDQLLDAIDYAHAKGVIHRDIKPENIFINKEGRVKLADFGIAHVDDSSFTKATMVGTVLGTPGYMSPEQATGASVDRRSDLFSIGVVGYEMLSGHNPFGAGDGTDPTTLLYRIVHEPAPQLPESLSSGLPTDLRPAIMAALQKNPDDRPQTATEFKSMLHGGTVPYIKSNVGVKAKVQKSTNNWPKWTPYVVAGAACVVALAVIFGFFSLGGGGRSGGTSSVSSVADSDPVYLAPVDGKVAIYTNSSSEPYEVIDLLISDLPSNDQSAINSHMGFGTVEEAKVKVKALQETVAETKRAAEEAAAAEAAKKAAEEAAAARNNVTINVVGADGQTRTATIRLSGNSERVIPDSNTRALSQSEIDALSDAELCVAWNEIIAAANGYMFKNSGLSTYFNNRSWYYPNPNGSASVTGVAAENVERLQNALSDPWWLRLATY